MEVPDRVVLPAAPSRRSGRPRFQFGLRALLIAMTGFAVLLSALFSGPSWVAALTVTILITLAPMCLTIGLVHGRGYLRTFCIGGMFPAIAILSWIGPLPVTGRRPMDWPGLWTNLGIGTGIALGATVIAAFGFTAIVLRWLIEQSAQPTDDTPFQPLLRPDPAVFHVKHTCARAAGFEVPVFHVKQADGGKLSFHVKQCEKSGSEGNLRP